MKKLLFLFLILLVIPIAFALDCKDIIDKDNCNYILNSDISSSNKDYLISALISNQREFPDFDSVYKWNTAKNTSESPYNTTKYEKGYIKDAWLKTLALMPSILDNETLLVSDNGKVLSASNYKIEIPYGKLIGSDCRTDYTLLNKKSSVNNYINDIYQGNRSLFEFKTNEINLKFTNKLDVEINTKIDHYQWYSYCCARSKKGCTQWCKECRFSNTEIKKDTLLISDSINAKRDYINKTYSFNITNRYNDNTKGKFDFNATAFELLFDNSKFIQTNYIYVPEFSIPPYDILTLRALPLEEKSFSNMFFENNTFIVKNTNGCKIITYSHFNKTINSCNLNYNPIGLSLNTDKLAYFENDTIKVNIIPNNINVELSYANKTKIVKGNTELKVIYPYNNIVVKYNDISSDKVISVTKQENLNLFFQLGTFLGLNYIMILVGVRKFAKVL